MKLYDEISINDKDILKLNILETKNKIHSYNENLYKNPLEYKAVNQLIGLQRLYVINPLKAEVLLHFFKHDNPFLEKKIDYDKIFQKNSNNIDNSKILVLYCNSLTVMLRHLLSCVKTKSDELDTIKFLNKIIEKHELVSGKIGSHFMQYFLINVLMALNEYESKNYLIYIEKLEFKYSDLVCA